MKRYGYGLAVGLVAIVASATPLLAGLSWEWAPFIALFMTGTAASVMRSDA
jgi:hypothetical protein